MWSALAALPALFGKLLDLIADWQRRRDERAARARLEAEVRSDVAQEIAAAETVQETTTHDAFDRARTDLPDRVAAADRLRHGQF